MRYLLLALITSLPFAACVTELPVVDESDADAEPSAAMSPTMSALDNTEPEYTTPQPVGYVVVTPVGQQSQPVAVSDA